ncbi:MAG: RNA polymerase sigma factor, partial [Prevotella sp.]|nr:RNA polymerase sigma factor [Prevotella sp.]
DIKQLERTIDEWQDGLYSLAYFRLGDADSAQDVVQEAFIRYYNENRRNKIAHTKAWLYRTTLNLATDHLRQRRATMPLRAALEKSNDSEDALFREYLRIEEMLASLPEEQAAVVRLHFTDDLSFAEIADILGISRDTAKSRYRYALEKLRKEFLTRR